MKIPIAIAEKLILLKSSRKFPASKIKHKVINEMLENGVLKKQIHGRNKALIYCIEQQKIDIFLQNHYGISNLQDYINVLQSNDATRAEAVSVSSDSKSKKIRTFKGFLINSYNSIQATINGKSIIINPTEGMFQFIYDLENFIIPKEVVVIGIENSENFRYIEKQKYLFGKITPLFVSRYPQNQSKDLLKWLQTNPNSYLHFGDFDFEGIKIYLSEYKKYLGEKAKFFIPENIEQHFEKYGNKDLYDKQMINFDLQSIEEESLINLIELIHKHKKGLEQEVLISNH